jgi:hypothetical protein
MTGWRVRVLAIRMSEGACAVLGMNSRIQSHRETTIGHDVQHGLADLNLG